MESRTNPRYSYFKAVLKPLSLMVDKLRFFLLIGAVFAVLMTIFSYVSGQKYICHQAISAIDANCSYSATGYLLYFLIRLIFISLFLTFWSEKIFLDKQITPSALKQSLFVYIKNIPLIFIFLALNSFPIISTIILFERIPNPDWIVELGFFTVVGLGFLVPFILMLFYTNIAEYFLGKPWTNFGQIFTNSSQHTFKIILSVLSVFLIILLIMVVCNNLISSFEHLPLELYNIAASLISNTALLFLCVLFLNFMYVQKELLLPLSEGD